MAEVHSASREQREQVRASEVAKAWEVEKVWVQMVNEAAQMVNEVVQTVRERM